MKYLIPSLLAASLIGGGIGFSNLALASDDDHRGPHHEGKHDGKGCDRHKAWMKDLSDEQRKKIDAMHADYKTKKMAIKEKMRDAKVALATEMTKDAPKQKDIDKKIDAILKLKREKMQLKVAHKIEVRKVLTKEQRVQFDEHVMNKAKYGRKGHYGKHDEHGHRHHD